MCSHKLFVEQRRGDEGEYNFSTLIGCDNRKELKARAERKKCFGVIAAIDEDCVTAVEKNVN